MQSSINPGLWLLAVGRRLPLLFLAPLILLAAVPPSQYSSILAGYTSWYLIVCHVVLIIYGIFALSLINSEEKSSLADVVLIILPGLAVAYASWQVGHSLGLNFIVIAIEFALLFFLSGLPGTKVVLARIAPFAWGLVYIAGIAAFAYDAVHIPRWIGGLILLISGLGQLTIGLFLLQSLGPVRAIGVTIFLIVLFLLAPRYVDIAPAISKADYRAPLGSGLFKDWLEKRGDLAYYKGRGRPYPVILVSAEGGGIYAAAHSFAVLRKLQIRCPSFSQHVLAAVGVSGGSIGLAQFVAATVDEAKTQLTTPQCGDGVANLNFKPLTTDHLSPILARWFFIDVIQSFLPWNFASVDRATVLGLSLLEATESSTGRRLLETPMNDTWNAASALPAIIPVATDSTTGQRLLFSPLVASDDATKATFFPDQGNRDIRLIDAAVTSARFPWLTPTARLELAENKYRVLADGGYFENSGADTVVDIRNSIMAYADETQRAKRDEDMGRCKLFVQEVFTKPVTWTGCDMHVMIVHLVIAAGDAIAEEESVGTAAVKQTFLFDPVLTMLRTRTGRGDLAIARARGLFCGPEFCVTDYYPDECGANTGYFRASLPVSELSLPLGWHLSNNFATAIDDYTAPAASLCSEESPNAKPIAQRMRKLGLAGPKAPTPATVPNPLEDKTGMRELNACDAHRLTFLLTPSPREVKVHEVCSGITTEPRRKRKRGKKR